MDRNKTGQLIAAARKEKQMTQKGLAELLHVSDRAVSKWERGSGFPDVALLEPLASALDLRVLDLLRGERTEEKDVHTAVQAALHAVQEQQRKHRRETRRAKLCFAAVLTLFLLALVLLGFLRVPLHHTVLAGVYENGVQTAVTEVEVDGSLRLGLTGLEYWGSLKLPLSKLSMDPERELQYEIPISLTNDPTHVGRKSWFGNVFEEDRPFVGERFCPTLSMKNFAFDMTDDRVVATSPAMYERYAQIYSAAPLNKAE